MWLAKEYKNLREGEVMSYTVKSSEKTRKSGAETETKALLYLMNLRKDSGRKIIWKVLLKRMQIF